MLVRKDLALEQQAVQSVHATAEAVKHLYNSVNHLHTVLLHVENERELIKAMQYLDSKGIRYRHFIDPDLNNELTAVATECILGSKRKVMKDFKLLKMEVKPK